MSPLTRREALGAAALATAAALPATAAAATREPDADLATLARLLALERDAHAAYAAAAAAPELGARLRRLAARFAAHEREHARELEAALETRGASPSRRAPRGRDRLAGAGSPAAALRRAAELERAAVAACHEALGALSEGAFIQLAARIMAGHAQHLAVLREAIGANPSPTAFETGAQVE